ncbi:MAG: hypothetical protein R3244_13580 [Thermoanaerobaculia bacterium]|nr:hypothetical protein [Thermoanaerobaculia bacterium]
MSPHDDRPRIGFLPFLAFLFVSGFLWTSQTSLRATVQDNQPELEALRQQLAATEAEVEALRSSVGAQSQDVMAMKLGEVYRTPGVVDLGGTGAQILGHGFAVTGLALEPIAGGHLLEGRLINLQAVRHQELVFGVALGHQKTEFTLADLEPGQSLPFSLFFDDTEMAMPRFARFDYRESIIWHRASEPADD